MENIVRCLGLLSGGEEVSRNETNHDQLWVDTLLLKIGSTA